MSDALPCIASLVKISDKVDYIWWSIGQKSTSTLEQPKMMLSAAAETFAN